MQEKEQLTPEELQSQNLSTLPFDNTVEALPLCKASLLLLLQVSQPRFSIS